MHSFQPSRGRIVFEAFCALAVSASFVGAWMQTGASALLAAAVISAMYGLTHARHATGLKAVVAEPPAEKPAPVSGQPPVAVDEEPEAADVPAAVDIVENEQRIAPEEPQPKARKAKSPRKSSGRRASASKQAIVAEVMAFEEPVAADFAPTEESAPPEDAEVAEFPHFEDEAAPHIAPLFEPEPFARMPRRAFGRRGRI